MENTAVLLFSDHTWYCVMQKDIDNWCANHKWKSDCYKAVIIIYPNGIREERCLEEN